MVIVLFQWSEEPTHAPRLGYTKDVHDRVTFKDRKRNKLDGKESEIDKIVKPGDI